jgi:hypothetical protein
MDCEGGTPMGLLDALVERAMTEALAHFDYGDDQLRDWLAYLEQDAPQYFAADGSGAITVPAAHREAFAKVAMMAAVNAILHGSPPN